MAIQNYDTAPGRNTKTSSSPPKKRPKKGKEVK
jgi:hypothetical protein